MKRLATLFCLALLGASTHTVWADGIGLTVVGNLSVPSLGPANYFDSSNSAVPLGYGNSATAGTAVIGSGIEFGATNSEDLLTIDFTGTEVTVTDSCVGGGCGTTPYEILLYNPYITGYSLESLYFPNVSVAYGFDAAYGGNVGTLSFTGASDFTGGSAVFSYTSVLPPPAGVVPEPGTLGLVLSGLAVSGGAIRRRLQR